MIVTIQGDKMLDTIYVTQPVEGQLSFMHIWRELWEGDERYSRHYLGQGQGRTPEEAIADYIRLEIATLEDAAAQLKKGTLDIEETWSQDYKPETD
jgi:hypothetical protein